QRRISARTVELFDDRDADAQVMRRYCGGQPTGTGPDHQNVGIRLHIAPHAFIISATTSRHAAEAIAEGSAISRRKTPGIEGNTSEVSSSIFPRSSTVENG